ncbi:hypothetical protein ACEPPN_003341 [Leptodophora sp. 'Broadleaf-Isolate-01']
MYATASPPWLPTQLDPYSQDPYATISAYAPWPPANYTPPSSSPTPSPPPTASKTSKSNEDPSYLAWKNAKEEALTQQLAEQKAAREAAEEKRAEKVLNEKIEARLEFGENLRKRFLPDPDPNPDLSSLGASEVVWKEKEEREREKGELERLRWEDGERKRKEKERMRREEMEGLVEGMKEVVLEKVGVLERMIEERERKEKSIKEEKERERLKDKRGRGRERRSRRRSRSRSRSRHRTRRGRNHGAGGAIRYPYGFGNGNGYSNGMVYPPSLQLSGRASYASQPLIYPPANLNAFQNNQTVPYKTTTHYPYDDPVRTYQFESTARGISGKIDQLEKGQQTMLNRFGQLDTKLDNMDEKSTWNLKDLNDTLRDLRVSRKGSRSGLSKRRGQSPAGY